MSSLREAARENDLVRNVGLAVAFAAVFSLLSGDPPTDFVRLSALIVLVVIVTGIGTLVDAFDYPRAFKTVGLGAGFLSVSAYWLLVSVEGPDVLSWFVTVLGAVYVLLGAVKYRTGSDDGSATGSSAAGETVRDEDDAALNARVRHTIADAVRDEPRTVPQLADDLDLTESRVEGALTLLEYQGRVRRKSGVYHSGGEKSVGGTDANAVDVAE